MLYYSQTNRQEVYEMTAPKKPPITKSFGYAFEGIFTCIRKERNKKIHCIMAVLVVIAGIVLIAAIMAAIAGLIIFVPKGLVFLGLL